MMLPGNRMKTGTCPCCKLCKNYPGFQKVLDRPNAGFILYRHITHVEDINKKTGVIEASTDTIDDVFIIENTQGAVLEKIDFAPEIDRSPISCPRCVNVLKHAKNLFKNKEIGNSDVIGICEHCRQKSQLERPCPKCDKIVEKFQQHKRESKQTHAHQVKTWLSKIKQLITLILDEDKGKITESPIKHGHSDTDISKLLKKVSKTEREPEIEDLFMQNMRGPKSAMKRPASEGSYFLGSIKEVAFDEQDEAKPTYGTPREADVFKPLLHTQSNTTLTENELEKDFIRKYGKSYKEKRSFGDLKPKVRYVDDSYNELIPSTDVTGDDKDFVPTNFDVHGRKRERIVHMTNHRDEYTLNFDLRHVKRKKPIVDSDSRNEGVGQKDSLKESNVESDKKKSSILDSDSRQGGNRKGKVPAGRKYREDDNFILAPKTHHEEDNKKTGKLHDSKTSDENMKMRVTRDTKKEDFISVIGKRFEEEIEAKGLTLASKKSQAAKKQNFTTASETCEKRKDIISTYRDHKITKKTNHGNNKILFESPSRIKKYHSDESLLVGISKMNEEMKMHKSFGLYFPEKPGSRKKNSKVESGASSAELIKDTMDKLKTNTDKGKILREHAGFKNAADKIRPGSRFIKKSEDEKLDQERLLADNVAVKLVRETEREQSGKSRGL